MSHSLVTRFRKCAPTSVDGFIETKTTQHVDVYVCRVGGEEDGSSYLREHQPEDEAEPEAPASKSVLGLTITPLTDDLRTELGADDSVEGLAVTEVDEMSEVLKVMSSELGVST